MLIPTRRNILRSLFENKAGHNDPKQKGSIKRDLTEIKSQNDQKDRCWKEMHVKSNKRGQQIFSLNGEKALNTFRGQHYISYIKCDFWSDDSKDKRAIELINDIRIAQQIQLYGNFSRILLSNELIFSPQDLKKLCLSAFRLPSVPHYIFKSVSLVYLDLSFNQITQVPNQILQLINLQELYFSHNSMTGFPMCVLKLPNLQKFYISFNYLTFIPEEIRHMEKLKELAIDNNRQVRDLPEAFYFQNSLTSLKVLNLEGTNFFRSVNKDKIKILRQRGIYIPE